MATVEILVVPTTVAMTTLAAVKAEIATTATDDAIVMDMILRASATIERMCGRTFARATYRETFHSLRRSSIILSRWPVAEIQSVTANGEIVDASLYVESAGILESTTGCAWRAWRPSGTVIVDYVAGYVMPGQQAANLPADLEHACIALVKGMFLARERDPSLRSESVDGIASASYLDAGPLQALSPIIESYRVPSIG